MQKTATSTGTTKYTLHGKNIVHLTNGNDELHFFYDAQGRLALVEYNGMPYRYVHNLQGDVVALVDGNGNKVVEYWYDAWGRPLCKTGTLASTLGTLQPFRYRGYVWDEEIGLYYLRSRYYRVEYHGFLNPDEINYMIESTLNSNMYMYCREDPINKDDKDGHAWWHWLVGAAVVAACAVAVVVTAGGATAAVAAVASTAMGYTAGSVATTTAASAFIGSATAYGTAVAIHAMDSSSFEDFAERGSGRTVAATVGGGLLGAGIGYASSKAYYDTHQFGYTSPDKLENPKPNSYYTQWNGNGEGIRSFTRFDATGHQLWRVDYIGRSHGGISTPHLHIYERKLGQPVGKKHTFTFLRIK